MRRVACIALAEIRLEIAVEEESRKGGEAAPFASWRAAAFAVVIARPGGTVKAERDISGSTRLDVVSSQAKAQEVRSGQTVAAARAKCAHLRVRVVAENAVRDALTRVAEAALAFGPSVAFSEEKDLVWVEIGGCAHLHGGERGLAVALGDRVRAMGHACRIAIADGPRIAAAVARFFPCRTPREIEVVPEGQGAAAMCVLPTAALELDDDRADWLLSLGLCTCGALQKLPRRELGIRLGVRAHEVFQLLSGEDLAPLKVWHPPEVPEEHIDLEWGASSIEALAFVMKTLCDRLAARLEGRGSAAARLELVFALDRALCEGEKFKSTFDLVLAVPIARAADLLAVLRARIERETLHAPVRGVTLRVSELVNVSSRPTLSLFVPEPKAERVLPRLVAELTAELGDACVGTLALVDTWVPDRRTQLASFGSSRRFPRHALTVSALEPSRLVPSSAISRRALVGVEFLERIEAVEWWRQGAARCDVVAAWLEGKQYQGALAWLVLEEGSQDARLCGFFD